MKILLNTQIISLHYYDITPNEFEINNPNNSLTVSDENNKRLYTSKNNSANKAQIVKLKNNRCAAIKPLKNKFIKLNKLLASFLHIELREHTLQNILKNKTGEIEIANIDNSFLFLSI